jgi:AraC-like DNA-binding protein
MQHLTNKVWLDVVKELLVDAGVDAVAELEKLTLSGLEVCDLNGQVDTRSAGKAWSMAAERLDNPAIGLFAANHYFQPAMWGSLGLGILCSSSIRDALERMARHSRVFTDVSPFTVVKREQLIGLVMESMIPLEDIGYESADFAIACFTRLFFEACSGKFSPKLIKFPRPAPENVSFYEMFFNSEVEFGSEYAAIFYSSNDVDKPFSMSNRELALSQDQLTVDYIERLNDWGLIGQVRHEIHRALTAGNEPQCREVAESFNLSQRSFQRKLSEEGVTFKLLLSEERKQLAIKYLRRPYTTLNEAAYLLGFSDHSSFTRAFKRWYGCAPTEFREGLVCS